MDRKRSPWALRADENYQRFVTLLGQKAAAAVERHLELCEADAAQDYGRTWKRLAGMLGALAPAVIESLGHQTLKFHIPDGKYRQQVFALSDTCQGRIELFLPDVSTLAITRNIIAKPALDNRSYGIVGENATVELQVLTSDDKDCPPFCKPMLGWGRKAIRVLISAIPEEPQLAAVERLCELAAESWKDKVQTAPVAAGRIVGSA